MNRPIIIKVLISVVGIGLILFVLLMSITRQVLYSPTAEELTERRQVTINQRLNELRAWPPAPDNPAYPLRMVHDQVRLFITPDSQKPKLQFELATDRLDSAEKLIARKRLTLALSTLTKSTKYVLSAVVKINETSPKASNPTRALAERQISHQIEALKRLKPSFSDEQKAVIDRLLLELNALRDQFL